MPRVLYHYTSQIGYDGILRTNVIHPSLKANNPKDARFGEGQYLSDILPNTKRPSQLSMIFFGIPWAGKRFTHHIDLRVDDLHIAFGRTHVYVNRSNRPLNLNGRLMGHGRNL